MKTFAVTAIIFCNAETPEKAKKLAQRHVSMKNGSCLALEMELPVMEVKDANGYEARLSKLRETLG